MVDDTEQKVLEPEVAKPKSKFAFSKLSLIIILVAALGAAASLWWLLHNQPIQPEQKQVVVKIPAKTDTKTGGDSVVDAHAIDCGDKAAFVNELFGMKFCYPSAWGTATLYDAKLATSDVGYRQVVKFSDMPYVQVGAVSDDWSTTLGRGGVCFDPSNQMPLLSSYNTDWHDQIGSGSSLEFAIRSLASLAGGYSMTEAVSNILQSGVCARGYKVVNATHYRVGSVSYYRDFSPALGVTSPAGHVAAPNVLLSTQMRADFDALLASLVVY